MVLSGGEGEGNKPEKEGGGGIQRKFLILYHGGKEQRNKNLVLSRLDL
jgi:hypothetical protein